MAGVDYAALKKGGFMRQKQKGFFSLRIQVVGLQKILRLWQRLRKSTAKAMYI